ncbi:5,10-methylenetetrahydrofolate reductase [Saccharibacter sp. 17.LH.SD]|uniref:methylenetetrahydrofolate reductase n=1 Tax=Saccharibacter sp. 17.LH.SD TaxID=2689393 RepID=UPI00136C114D|nr:methylenetetrahydrofolate reductase [Saccharibacter sp. 17.LH.SD]MXV43743.1 5,10-methylenetetrahydrofolate reductase [Saccharibacter sp. 17.LH.SD]
MPEISFEFFPAKTEDGAVSLLKTAQTLAEFDPRFMSVTYGAGGSTQGRTLATLCDMAKCVSVPLAGHLTCVGASKGEVDDVARSFWDAGIRHIVALRGDPRPVDGKAQRFEPHPQGYRNAAELVSGLKKIAPFEISVAAYPETHPEALSPEADLDNLKRKFDAGADRAITQFFFDADIFLRFRDRLSAAHITKPVIPGILPLSSAVQAWKFAAMCGASIPEELRVLYGDLDKSPAVRARISAILADRLCQKLVAEEVGHFHFYTLNQAVPCSALSLLLRHGKVPSSLE